MIKKQMKLFTIILSVNEKTKTFAMSRGQIWVCMLISTWSLVFQMSVFEIEKRGKLYVGLQHGQVHLNYAVRTAVHSLTAVALHTASRHFLSTPSQQDHRLSSSGLQWTQLVTTSEATPSCHSCRLAATLFLPHSRSQSKATNREGHPRL